MWGKRILLLVPHADDEVVASAASLGRAQREGAEIFVLYLTHGCTAREALWPWQRQHYEKFNAKRRAEAENVAGFLNIKPVGWSQRPARTLKDDMPKVREEIEIAIRNNHIDQLWVPAYEGGNADHDALNGVAQLFRKRMSVLEFAEYNFCGGKSHAQDFPYHNGTEQILTLTPDEQKKKTAALRLYKSEKKNLGYVGIRQECCRPLALYDYSQPPHPGPLWYARFQWVPFRHPRVDFTKPAAVSAAIMSFLDASASDLLGLARQ